MVRTRGFHPRNRSSILRDATMNRPKHSGHKKWTLVGGEVIQNVHSIANCSGTHCVIHNPSDHHMRSWKMHWRGDRSLMERICPEHGVGHPDPDDINPDKLHGCCGCCDPENKYNDLD